ncbi:helix-turn-helix transcriptional regulator [Ornithinimicrobium cryptoxanthini]|uniref:Helix-turn-helix domain-containing protein n=1 Tax=Ornithinimicrobium cryptoxanthini TaxID=2934161 RepID=A0ABY4YID2_9MICO|nr:helix-turn-helix domain-containing protein [Ornithinimicrobium cryptoxanthini]USQ76260.1 helix-turn-helix domain-containing protein [Ornithinimicrobium cryptoxanthini]
MTMSRVSAREPGESAARRAGERRADLLAAITAAPRGLGIRALAEATGIHENTVRFHLGRLLDDGLVERQRGVSSGPGRPPLTFVARRDREGAGRDNYELIAAVLTDLVDSTSAEPGVVAQEAGRVWARRQAASRSDVQGQGADAPSGWDAALDELTRVLDDAGFAPELQSAPDGATVRVHNCPFLSIARSDQAVPCGVHLGLMEGVLEAAGAPGTVDQLVPFVTPTLCVAHLSAQDVT